MGRVVKFVLSLLVGFAVLFVLASIALFLFFDPNDFREDISKTVKSQTGRDLIIEGDISLDVFPWLAVEIGKASLGNAPGFGNEPMASFDRASFSVRLLPVILRQEVVVGTARIESLHLNLRVDEHGVSNWSDLIPDDSPSEAVAEEAPTESDGGIDVNSIEVINATIRYTNDESGEVIVIDEVDLNIGRLRSDGSAVPFAANLTFDVQPAGLSGSLTFDTSVSFDADSGMLLLDGVSIDGVVEGVASIPTKMSLLTDGIEVAMNDYQIAVQPLDLTMLDMHIVANIDPFSYENQVSPKAAIAIDAFSPRTLMQLFDVAPPDTADPIALSRVIVSANAELTTTAIEMTDVDIKLDDTSFTGTLSVPRGATGFYQFDLLGDSIELARYMEPATSSGDGQSIDSVPVEIPVDLIRSLNARGKFRLKTASLGNIIFEDIDVGLNSSNGKMRIFPISSGLFGGTYQGDVRIDVSGALPMLSMDETIADVDLALLAKAMFDQQNISGAIDGSFKLSGRGTDMAAIERDLDGSISLKLTDGSYTGTDIWYEIRRARALLRGEPPPEAVLPAQTQFSTVRLTGTVNDGVMRSNDLFAELPFMQLTGGGQVDIPDATVNYSLSARILERPEFLRDATPEELDEFTEAVIPIKITGSIASPDITPDLEKLLKNRVEEEIKDILKEKLKDLFN